MKVLLVFACAIAICNSAPDNVTSIIEQAIISLENINPDQVKYVKKRDIILIKTDKDDDDDTEDGLYGRQIARKLQRIKDTEQRILCEYLIETAIHKASLRRLTRATQMMDLSEIPTGQGELKCPDQEFVSNSNHKDDGNQNLPGDNDDLPFTSFYKRSANVPPEELKRLSDIHAVCQNSPHTFAQEPQLKKLRTFRENKQVQYHMFCMAEKYGLVKYDGQFNEETIKRKIAFVIKGNEDLNEIYRKCAVLKRSKEETITHFWLCLVAQGQEFYEHPL